MWFLYDKVFLFGPIILDGWFKKKSAFISKSGWKKNEQEMEKKLDKL